MLAVRVGRMLLGALLLVLFASSDAGRSDDLQIKDLVGQFRAAVQSENRTLLSSLFWPEAVVFHRGSADVTARAFINGPLAPRFAGKGYRWLSEDNSGRAEGSFAYVAQQAQLEAVVDGGATERQPHTFTFVLRRRGAKWRIAHLHWSSSATAAQASPRALPRP